MSKSIKFKRITTRDFEMFFQLDSPGYYVAKKAVAHAELAGALDTVELLVLTNKLFQIEFRKRMLTALGPHGKAEEYALNVDRDANRSAQIALETLGKERLEQILRETVAYVNEQSKVGTGLNDKVR
jgi:hypothetical protein